MNYILRFLYKYNILLFFIILESFSIYLVVKHNNFQNARFFNSVQGVTAYFSERYDDFEEYITLRTVNDQLVKENAELRNQLYKYTYTEKTGTRIKEPMLQKYFYIPAKVINNSTNKQYNYITINKGSKDGIKPEMGVVSADGIVGIVGAISENYAVVISLLNRNLKISAKFKRNNHFGSFEWTGKDYREGFLNDIPLHVKPAIGDTIITSGLSVIFPEGMLIGIVRDFKIIDPNFYTINVVLSNDFRRLTYVQVIGNKMKEEQEELEYDVNSD